MGPCFIWTQDEHPVIRHWHSNLSFYAAVTVRVPNLVAIVLQGQLPVISQGKNAGVAVTYTGVGVPAGFLLIVVHDQVAVSLQAQMGCTRATSVWSPHSIHAVDNKVTVLLQAERKSPRFTSFWSWWLPWTEVLSIYLKNSLVLPVLWQHEVSLFELSLFL